MLTAFSAHVAQLAEYIIGKDEVTGSIPVMGSRAAGDITEYIRYYF